MILSTIILSTIIATSLLYEYIGACCEYTALSRFLQTPASHGEASTVLNPYGEDVFIGEMDLFGAVLLVFVEVENQ